MIFKERRDEQIEAIVNAAMAVHAELGHGFLEPVYQEALEREFNLRAIPQSREQGLPIFYRGAALDTVYPADFICYGEIIVELEILKILSVNEESQIMNRMKAAKLEKGLLLNFGGPRFEYKRFVYSRPKANPQVS